jgi:hypothetical protein
VIDVGTFDDGIEAGTAITVDGYVTVGGISTVGIPTTIDDWMETKTLVGTLVIGMLT